MADDAGESEVHNVADISAKAIREAAARVAAGAAAKSTQASKSADPKDDGLLGSKPLSIKVSKKAGSEAPSTSSASTSSADAKKAEMEKLAKLPPKLRARLLARGIIKAEDLGETPPPAAAPAAASAPTSGLGTPPEPASGAPGTPPPTSGATGEASPPLIQLPPLGPPILPGLEGLLGLGAAPPKASTLAAPQTGLAGQAGGLLPPPSAFAPLLLPPPMGDLPPILGMTQPSGSLPKAGFAPPRSTVVAAASTTQVFSSAPVINKRPGEGLEESQEAKKAKLAAAEAALAASPAAFRAAAAAAAGSTEAVSWTFKDGVVTEANATPQLSTPPVSPTPQAPAAAAATEDDEAMPPPLPPGPPPPSGPPLPPGWVRVPHEGDFYYWHTTSNEVSWEHPGEKQQGKGGKGGKPKPKFTEEHKILWTDLGRIIGRAGINLKIIKASIGADIYVPRQGKGKGKDQQKGQQDGKGKSKGTKGEAMEKGVGRGIGSGDKKLEDDQFVTVQIHAETAYAAKGGKRCLEVMLGYGRNVETALGLLGVEMKMPSMDELTNGKASKMMAESKDGVDPMDPAAYSDAPTGGWSSGMKKPGRKEGGGGNREPADSKTANAERF